MRHFITPALLAASLAGPSMANADSDAGLYSRLFGGINFLDDTDFNVLGTVKVDNEYETGFVVGGALGYDYGKIWSLGGVRSEVELSYRENDIDVHSVSALGGDQPSSTGDASSTALMFNAYNDFHNQTAVTPYLGAGIGYAWADMSDFGIAAIPNVLDDDDSGFAWQLGAGVNYAMNKVLTLSVDYRYLNTDIDVTSSPAAGSTGSEVDLDNHTVSFGIRYSY
ncbi:MAG: outer membrane protein [Gammaproteobacteria bacterium]